MPKITAKLVAALEPGPVELFVWDSELRGYGVRVYPSGAKKYLVQWKRDGRTRRFGLGSHPLLKADAARAKALDTLARIERGEDPAEERDARKADRTVSELLDLYLAEGAGHLKAGTRETYASVFRRHVCPLLGERKLRSLKPADIAKMIDDIGNGRTARADRGRGEEARAGHCQRRTRHRCPVDRISRRRVRLGCRPRHARNQPLHRREEAQEPDERNAI